MLMNLVPNLSQEACGGVRRSLRTSETPVGCHRLSSPVIMDPWLSNGSDSMSNPEAFEDNFAPCVKLPDSEEYLAALEKKLAKLKERQSKKDLVESLEETRKSCMLRLVTEGTSSTENSEDLLLDTPINNSHSNLLRHIAPEKQALTLGELVELVKADQLSQVLAESGPSETDLSSGDNEQVVKQRLIINITSLCAIKPMKSMGYYCIGKASREMYFRVLAEENPTLNVLSYSPGPVNTDMISQIMTDVRDQEIKGMFQSMRESESILTVDQTVSRFIGILEKGEFKSGCRVDYFDSDM